MQHAQVTLLEARHLPVWGFPWQSNPWCRLVLGKQTVTSRRDDDTSREGSHRAPVWNQEFQLLVESPSTQVLRCLLLRVLYTRCGVQLDAHSSDVP